ncbi:hypothetical protein [Sagittula salina]|uniref:Uncharacterized protein n=1 Tax=Sagittula salina TaxID=2820268 RepID=A0A940MR36_9RHOB|nr:hypothetical protein [Sagittula salina]MBP0483849.1 hypothetical protein [Sagittula salina]
MHWVDLIAAAEKTGIVLLASSILPVAVLIGAGLANRREKPDRLPTGQLAMVALVFGCLACVTGLIAGASRTAVTGQVLPAALGLIGAVALYTVIQKEASLPVAGCAVLAFSLMLAFGTVLGSYERARSQAFAEAQRYDMGILKTQADIEAVINGYRRARALPVLDFSGE